MALDVFAKVLEAASEGHKLIRYIRLRRDHKIKIKCQLLEPIKLLFKLPLELQHSILILFLALFFTLRRDRVQDREKSAVLSIVSLFTKSTIPKSQTTHASY